MPGAEARRCRYGLRAIRAFRNYAAMRALSTGVNRGAASVMTR